MGGQPAGLLLNDLLDGFPVAWEGQRRLRFTKSDSEGSRAEPPS